MNGKLTRQQQQLVLDNLGLARSIVNRVRSCAVVGYDDLIGWGNLGLVEAALRFDPSRGFRFSTYAAWWVYNTVFGAIRDANGVKSGSRAAAFWRVWSEKSSAAVAAECGLDEREVEAMRARIRGGMTRLDDENSSAARRVADPADSPEQVLLEGELRVTVREAIAAQGRRAAACLRHRFEGDETLEQIGGRIKRSRECVRQIQNKALRKIGKRRDIKELAE